MVLRKTTKAAVRDTQLVQRDFLLESSIVLIRIPVTLLSDYSLIHPMFSSLEKLPTYGPDLPSPLGSGLVT